MCVVYEVCTVCGVYVVYMCGGGYVCDVWLCGVCVMYVWDVCSVCVVWCVYMCAT